MIRTVANITLRVTLAHSVFTLGIVDTKHRGGVARLTWFHCHSARSWNWFTCADIGLSNWERALWLGFVGTWGDVVRIVACPDVFDPAAASCDGVRGISALVERAAI